MFNKIPAFWMSLTLKIVFLATLFGLFLPAHSLDGAIEGEGLCREHKHKMTILQGEGCWYTPSYRPAVLQEEPVEQPLTINRTPMISKELLVPGGVVIENDERDCIKDTNHFHWQVHGQLTMEFGDETYTGSATLISPWHVLTSGRNLYNPVTKKWATNIQFHPGRNEKKLLHPPVSCVKKAILSGWKQGDEKSDMGILELSQDVGTRLGWNGLLCAEDAYLAKIDPICLTGYPGDKPLGTMWTAISGESHIFESQLTYDISASEGQNGATPWAIDIPFLNKGDYYSLGVHTYGIKTNGKGVLNLATRLTRSRLAVIEHLINTLF